MQITLKKTLIAGVGLLAALFFFLIAIVPVSRTIPGVGTISGSIMGVLSGDKASLDMVASQIKVESLSDVAGYKEAVEALTSAYKFFAVFAIILFALSACACIGAFFMKTPKGSRALTIPFLVIDIIFSIVVMVFAILLAASTQLTVKGSTISVGGPIIMWIVGIAMFIGMLISSGVVKEVVFVGKKN